MRYSGVDRVVLKNAETSAEVELTKIGAESSFEIRSPVGVATGAGTEYLAAEESIAEIITFDVAQNSLLEGWRDDEVPLTFTAYGENGEIKWLEETPISEIKKMETVSGKLISLTISFYLKSVNQNINAVEYYGWTDGNGNTITDGNGNNIILLSD